LYNIKKTRKKERKGDLRMAVEQEAYVQLVGISAYEENIECAMKECIWATTSYEKTKALVNHQKRNENTTVYLLFTSLRGDERDKPETRQRVLHGVAILGILTEKRYEWPRRGHYNNQPCFKITWVVTYKPPLQIDLWVNDVSDLTWTSPGELSSLFKKESHFCAQDNKLFEKFKKAYGPKKAKAKKETEVEKIVLPRGQKNLFAMGFTAASKAKERSRSRSKSPIKK
jgi:hypothetical protein